MPDFNGLGKDICKMRRESFKAWDLVLLILETLWLPAWWTFCPVFTYEGMSAAPWNDMTPWLFITIPPGMNESYYTAEMTPCYNNRVCMSYNDNIHKQTCFCANKCKIGIPKPFSNNRSEKLCYHRRCGMTELHFCNNQNFFQYQFIQIFK